MDFFWLWAVYCMDPSGIGNSILIYNFIFDIIDFEVKWMISVFLMNAMNTNW